MSAIDPDALRAKIRERIKECRRLFSSWRADDPPEVVDHFDTYSLKVIAYKDVLSIIDTLTEPQSCPD